MSANARVTRLPAGSPPWARILLLVLPLALVSTPAVADVFLNGVNITGVTGQTFEKATVRIDSAGNVMIDAPGYAVAGATTAPTAPTGSTTLAPTPRPRASSGRYYLVSSQNEVGFTSYEIDLYVNAKWILKLRGEQSQVVADITRFLRPGDNKVLIMAKKNMAKGLKSRSPEHFFRLVIGQGAEGGNNVMIERTLVDFKVTAAQMEDISREYAVQVN